MTNYLVQRFLWFRERGFVQITQKTLVSLFPFFLFSGIIRVISLSVFSELGYINQLFSVSDWLPAFKITGQVLINLSNFLGGLAGPYQPTLQENTQLVTMVEVLVQLV